MLSRPHTARSDACAVRARSRVYRARCSIDAEKVVHLAVFLLPPDSSARSSALHFQERSDQSEYSLVGYPPRDRRHQFVVVDPIKELLKIEVYHPAMALCDVLLRFGYRTTACWISRSSTVGIPILHESDFRPCSAPTQNGEPNGSPFHLFAVSSRKRRELRVCFWATRTARAVCSAFASL
jgi:hypothetical protein